MLESTRGDTPVVDKMGDDHFDDLLGESDGRGGGRGNLGGSIRRTRSLDPKPNSLDK
jgi:hypothetical protein